VAEGSHDALGLELEDPDFDFSVVRCIELSESALCATPPDEADAQD
jgi:hypothetical protein